MLVKRDLKITINQVVKCNGEEKRVGDSRQRLRSWRNAHKMINTETGESKKIERSKTEAQLLTSSTHPTSPPADQYQLLPFLYKKQSWKKITPFKKSPIWGMKIRCKFQFQSAKLNEINISPQQVSSDLKFTSTDEKERESESRLHIHKIDAKQQPKYNTIPNSSR